MKQINEIGNRYGKLLVIELIPYAGKSQRFFWKCICDCGSTVKVSGAQLRGSINRPGQKQCKECRDLAFGTTIASKRNSDSPIKNLYYRYKQSAVSRKTEFFLSLEDFKSLIFLPCAYCGKPPSNHRMRHKHSLVYNGIDRVNNGKGYTLRNCVPCCRQCNQAKMDFKKEDFLNWIKQVYAFNFGRIV